MSNRVFRQTSILLITLLAASFPVHAQFGDWEVAFPNVAPIRDLLWHDPPNTYYATAWPEDGLLQLVKSEDGGATWNLIATGLGTPDEWRFSRQWPDYAISSSNPSVLYRVYKYIERSEDSRATWKELVWDVGDPQIWAETSHWRVRVAPNNPNRIIYEWRGIAGVGAISIRDALTNDHVALGRSGAGGSIWTHPETSEPYFIYSENFNRTIGRIDSDSMEFIELSERADFSGGYGFASDDPTQLYVGWRDDFRRIPLRIFNPPSEEPIAEFNLEEFQQPGFDYYANSVAVYADPDAIYASITADTKVHTGVYVTLNRGADWHKVSDLTGQLYFLSSQPFLYLQTDTQLYRARLSNTTSVETHGKATTIWGELKRD